MKSKNKRNFKLASTFLKELKSKHAFQFDRITTLLEKYEQSETDSGSVFKGIIREIQSENDLINRLNQFLDAEHKVEFVSCEQSKEMITHIFEFMQRMTSDQLKFEEFLTLIATSAEKMDEMKITCLSEVGEFIMSEVHGYKSRDYWGNDFVAMLEGSINSYKNSAKTKHVQPSEKVSSHNSSVEKMANEGMEISKIGTEAVSKKIKPKTAIVVPSNGHLNGSQPKPVVVPQVVKELPAILSVEEPQQFNLRIESNVILALKSQISEQAYNCFVKSLSLHFKNLISFAEFIKLNENILLEVDKEVCLALKEMIESRSRAVASDNIFNIKYAKLESDSLACNRSYFKIITPLFESSKVVTGLINKTYLGIPRGNESAVNFDEPVASRTHKNLSEEALFKVEDEMHEIDSSRIQLGLTLKLVERLISQKLTTVEIDKICHKIFTIRTINTLYGGKSNQIIEEMKRGQKIVIDTVKFRLLEKLQLLKNARGYFVNNNWSERMSNNYYKALDARSNSIKIAERNFLNNKNLIEKLKTSHLSTSQMNNWISRFIGNIGDQKIELVRPEEVSSYCWNPVVCVGFQDCEILCDVFMLLKVHIKQSKCNNNEKQKSVLFLEKVIGNFFDIPRNRQFNVKVVDPNKINQVLHELERTLYPNKEFYYSEKITIKVNAENIRLMNEFNLQKNEDAENKSEINAHNNGPDVPQSPIKEAQQSEKDEVLLENSDISSHFNELIQSNESEEEGGKEINIEQVEIDAGSRVFYASYHFYVIYQYFIFLYERFNFAFSFAMASTAGLKLYEIFRQLIFMNIFGILDENNYEDSIRMLFDYNSGIFLNFERILAGCVKHIPTDEFSNYVLSLSPHIFGDKNTNYWLSEELLFAKTCFKLNEMNNKENKGYKANSFSAFNSNHNLNGNELVKFEFNKKEHVFLIHKVRSLLTETRKDLNFNAQIIENQFGILTKTVPTKQKKLNRIKKHVLNNLTYAFDFKKRVVEVKSGGTEDLMVTPHNNSLVELRKHKIAKLTKARSFREKLSTFNLGNH